MTKQAEIELLESLVQQTPRNSYLRSLLQYLQPQFQQDIRSDFSTLPDLRTLEHNAYEAEQVVLNLRKLQEKVRQEILEQRKIQSVLYNQLMDLKRGAFEAAASAETAINNFHKEK